MGSTAVSTESCSLREEDVETDLKFHTRWNVAGVVGTCIVRLTDLRFTRTNRDATKYSPAQQQRSGSCRVQPLVGRPEVGPIFASLFDLG
jgi:hypothetical protein